MTDQVFRSGCGHTPEDEQFDFCPICHIRELEQQVAEYEARDSRFWHSVQKRTDGQAQRIRELEDGIDRIAAEARDKGAYTWAAKLETLSDE